MSWARVGSGTAASTNSSGQSIRSEVCDFIAFFFVLIGAQCLLSLHLLLSRDTTIASMWERIYLPGGCTNTLFSTGKGKRSFLLFNKLPFGPSGQSEVKRSPYIHTSNLKEVQVKRHKLIQNRVFQVHRRTKRRKSWAKKKLQRPLYPFLLLNKGPSEAIKNCRNLDDNRNENT